MTAAQTSAWIERINQQELASLAVTVRKIQSVVGDANSSVHQLTDALLNDPTLTAKILRVANSPSYLVTPDPVTTISRAAALIGFDAIRNICITSGLLDTLMKDRGLPDSILDRLLNRLAASLHAAIQVRMMLGGANSRVREEAFLAALLAKVGESALWGLGSPEVLELDRALRRGGDADATVRARIGCSLDELSEELIKSWGLEEAVSSRESAWENRIDDREHVRLANELADCVAREGWNSPRIHAIVERVAALLDLPPEDTQYRLRACGKEAEELANCYGAGVLARRMCYRPPVDAHGRRVAPKSAPAPAPAPVPRPAAEGPVPMPVGNTTLQLKILRQMTTMMASKPDINTVIRTAMDGIHRGIGMDRTITALVTPDHKAIQTRFWLGDGGEDWSREFHFTLTGPATILQDCLHNAASFHYQSGAPGLLADRVAPALLTFCGQQDFLIAAIEVSGRGIGVLYADRARSRTTIGADEFDAFGHFAQQLNMCLGSLTQKRG